MAYRILLILGAVSLMACSSHDTTPTSNEPPSTGGPTGFVKADTASQHLPAAAPR